MKISLIQPSRNNLKYLKWSYDAIRKNQGDHTVEICIADDASTDGTWEWCQQILNEGDTFSINRPTVPSSSGISWLPMNSGWINFSDNSGIV